jgi:TonB family protein
MRVLLVSIALLLLAGCQSRTRVVGGGMYWDPHPTISLETVSSDDKSSNRIYPIWLIPKPAYPFQMLRFGLRGEVTARLTLAEDGSVRSVTILESSQREIEDSVRTAAARWRFRPLPDAASSNLGGTTVDYRVHFDPDDTDGVRFDRDKTE